MLRFAEEKDIDLWISIAKEVEHLFGPMTEETSFNEALHTCIYEKNAICIEDEENQVAGFVAFSRAKNEIEWLAVKKDKRGKGYGQKLLERVIEELNHEECIYVQTFSSETQMGKYARNLYLKNGFIDYSDAGQNPAGIDTVIMIRK